MKVRKNQKGFMGSRTRVFTDRKKQQKKMFARKKQLTTAAK